MSQRKQIVELARSLIGVPYKHMGRDLTGLDCLGVAIWIAEQIGIEVPHIGEYSRVPSGRRMIIGFRKYAIPIRMIEAQAGDFFHMAFTQQPQHVAIITEVNPWMVIHANSTDGKVVEHHLNSEWLSRVRGTYRFPEP